MGKLEPAVKWSGSKRSQAKEICKCITTEYDTYYELFCGGCSVLFYILNNYPGKFQKYICNDINKPLIELYKLIRADYKSIQRAYALLWKELNKNDDLERKKQFFNRVRTRFNETHNPKLFFFIMRTTTNGMPRYNASGEFNNSFHVTRNGMNPERTEKILKEWSRLLNTYDVQFYSKSYEKFKPKENDLVYLDPPYANTKGMYYGTIDYSTLWQFLENISADWLLSFDGIAGSQNHTVQIPKIYNEHVYLNSGNSSFRRVIGKSKDTQVQESLYIKMKGRK
jgi:DNA adenine methylase